MIVEKESGARFVYREQKLHPVLNYASALLIVGADRSKTVLVSRRTIDGVPRGLPLGIADAPDSLPAPGRLSATAWTVCSTVPAGAGVEAPRSALLIGTEPDGGRPLGDDALLLRHPDGGLHLVWHQRRYLVRDPSRVLAALATTRAQAVPVAPALLNSLPAGTDLAPLDLPALGQPATRVPGAAIGDGLPGQQLRRRPAVRGGADAGLAGITELQAGSVAGPHRAGRAGADDVGSVRRAAHGCPTWPRPARTPRHRPRPGSRPATAGRSAPASATTAGLVRCAGAAAAGPDGRAPHRADRRAVLADHVVVEPGRGAVVEAAAAPGATGGAVSVVTDLGRRYVLADREVLADARLPRRAAGAATGRAGQPGARRRDPRPGRRPRRRRPADLRSCRAACRRCVQRWRRTLARV